MSMFSWLGNFAVFYMLLLAMVTIPLLIFFVVLGIRAALDYRNWILGGFVVLIGGAALLLIRKRKRLAEHYEQEKKDVMEVVRAAAREGHNVNISFLHGLIRIDYEGGMSSNRLIGDAARGPIKSLPIARAEDDLSPVLEIESGAVPSTNGPLDVTGELERLSDLKDRGAVTETEFLELKQRLLYNGKV